MNGEANIEEGILKLKNDEGYLEYDLNGFKKFYHKVINQKILHDYTAIASFIEDLVLIRFPEKPNVKVVIREESKFLEKDDFSFLLNAEYFGTFKGKLTFSEILKEDVKLNGKKLLFVFTLFLSSISLGYENNMILTLNEMILTSITIFLSIFLAFVLSQKSSDADARLMKDGSIYYSLQRDKYILSISILLVFLCIMNIELSFFGSVQLNRLEHFLTSLNGNKVVDLLEVHINLLKNIKIITLSILTSLNSVFLAICYISIVQYYFEKERFLRCIYSSETLLQESVLKYNSKNNK